MAYSAPSNTRSNTYKDVSLQQGKKSTAKQVLDRQIMPATGDRPSSVPSRPLRDATYKR